MAELFASEVAMEIALNAVRIHDGYGYSTEYDVERYCRDAPLMIVGGGVFWVIIAMIYVFAGVVAVSHLPSTTTTTFSGY